MAAWELQDLGHDGVPRPITDEASLRSALHELARLEPRVVLIGINANESLDVGIGGRWAFVEHVVLEPWKAEVATPAEVGADKPASLRFLYCGAFDTEIPAEFLMPVSEAIELVVDILRSGALPDAIRWTLM